jgi:ribonuclease VapC
VRSARANSIACWPQPPSPQFPWRKRTSTGPWWAGGATARGATGQPLYFGDCFSYGLARSLEAPLLFKGDDFTATDLLPALPT